MTQCRQLRSVYFALRQSLEDLRRQCFFLFVDLLEEHFKEGEIQVAKDVADGLHLSPKLVVDEDERSLLLFYTLKLHIFL